MKYLVLIAGVVTGAACGFALSVTFGAVGLVLSVPTGLFIGWGASTIGRELDK